MDDARAVLAAHGFRYVGMCNCAQKGYKYKLKAYMVKVTPSIAMFSMTHQNKTIIPHGRLDKLPAILQKYVELDKQPAS
jgi:hypothetical protein